MEFLYSLLTFILLLFPLSFFFRSKVTKSLPGGQLPPGRSGWPIIGETIEFMVTGWLGHPEKFIVDRMSKFSPKAFRTSLMFQDVAVFCGSLGNKFLFSNENKLVQVWWPASVNKVFPSSNNASNEHSLKLRKMLPNFFKPEPLQNYIPIMDHITRRHFASLWDNNKQVVVFPLTKKFTFWVACKIFVSIEDPQDVERLQKPFEHIIRALLSVPIDLPGTLFRRGINAANAIRKELMAIIKQRRIDFSQGKASATQDILSHMLLYSDDSGKFMKDYEVADKILGLLIGGHDTASSACAFIVKYLAELPDIYHGCLQGLNDLNNSVAGSHKQPKCKLLCFTEQLEIAKSKASGELLNWEDIHKMKYSWNVACEVLRLAPPVQGAFQEAMTDFIYDGFHIPKGWKLYWNVNSTHTNPEFYPDPQKFDPSRFDGSGPAPFTYVPFGGGPRMCPGKEYARLEILVFMHHLVTKHRWEKVIPDEIILVNPTPSPAKGLPIRLYLHTAN